MNGNCDCLYIILFYFKKYSSTLSNCIGILLVFRNVHSYSIRWFLTRNNKNMSTEKNLYDAVRKP